MSFITDLFSGGASKLVDSVGTALDKVITTKGEKMQLDNEIKKADLEFQLEMQKLSVEERRLVYQDTAGARTREITISTSANATKLSKNISSYLAIAATLLCFALFYIMIFNPTVLKPEMEHIVIYILGVLSALLTQVYSYYFGSSTGSAAKSVTLENALNQKSAGS